ncbi:MAG TPA: pirin-like C-terminal cupin domain-containing protein [Chitinophagaceae bacterium]|nr:pirin-like C-terminal cupin domain-containing protein [Chitinophagaceae bacterium]
MKQRKIKTVQTPAAEPGFLGAGHTARAVIQVNYKDSDPFILLMDDVLDKKDGTPAGGPHPHAGFETVSLLIEGVIGEGEHQMNAGDMQIMTAGSGVIHTETINTELKMRLLQLWLNLPKKNRHAAPRLQHLPVVHVPVATGNGFLARVYSGTFAGVTSPIENQVPVIIADITLQPGITMTEKIPSAYSTFVYILNGNVTAGENKELLKQEQVGWFDRDIEKGDSEVSFTAGADGARLILYSGQPQGDPIVSHGPFIADTEDDIRRLYREYREGKMNHISTVPADQQVIW